MLRALLVVVVLLLSGRTAWAGVTISPSSASVPPGAARTFFGRGGAPPYAFALVANGSQGTVATDGVYVAGPHAGRDEVRVTDSAGAAGFASVVVGAPLAIEAPGGGTFPGGSLLFAASGGGEPYVWSLAVNASGGSVVESGRYFAGPSGGTVDTLRVTDAVGAEATVDVSVGPSLAVSPGAAATEARDAITFTATGGSGEVLWSLASSVSGGAIDPVTGAYVAGEGGGVDVVVATDAVGTTVSVEVTVAPPAPAMGPDAGASAVMPGTLPGVTPPAGASASVPGATPAASRHLNLAGGGSADNCSCQAVGTRSSGAGLALLVIAGAVLRRRRLDRRALPT